MSRCRPGGARVALQPSFCADLDGESRHAIPATPRNRRQQCRSLTWALTSKRPRDVSARPPGDLIDARNTPHALGEPCRRPRRRPAERTGRPGRARCREMPTSGTPERRRHGGALRRPRHHRRAGDERRDLVERPAVRHLAAPQRGGNLLAAPAFRRRPPRQHHVEAAIDQRARQREPMRLRPLLADACCAVDQHRIIVARPAGDGGPIEPEFELRLRLIAERASGEHAVARNGMAAPFHLVAHIGSEARGSRMLAVS